MAKPEPMQKDDSNTTSPRANDCYLTDFCQSESNLRLILVLELIAIAFALSSFRSSGGLMLQLALTSILLLWIGLLSAAMLCAAKRMGLLCGTLLATLLSLLIVALVTALITLLAYQVDQWLQLEQFTGISRGELVLRFCAIGLILYGLALRYFYIQFVTRKMVKTESRARLQALQARIQ